MFGSVLFTPSVSPPIPGVNGTPEVAANTPPICHPPRSHPSVPELHLGVPNCQEKVISRLWVTLKSESPRFSLGLNQRGLAMEFVYSSPTRLPEEVSKDLPHVYE